MPEMDGWTAAQFVGRGDFHVGICRAPHWSSSIRRLTADGCEAVKHLIKEIDPTCQGGEDVKTRRPAGETGQLFGQ